MVFNVVMIRKIIVFPLIILGLSGCSSQGIESATGEPVVGVFDTFKRGEIRLTCEFSCSGAWGLARKEAKQLYSQASWLLLVDRVARVGYLSDQTYFYLGSAAESLGYYQAAKKYYDLAKISFKCNGIINNCDGFVFPRDITAGLSRLPNSQDSSRQFGISNTVRSQVTTSSELVAKDNASPRNESADSVQEKLVTEERSSSGPTAGDKLITPERARAKINAYGYPEVLLTDVAAERLVSDLRGDLISKGWFISDDSASGFTAIKKMDARRAAGEAFAASVLRGQRGYIYNDAIYFYIQGDSTNSKLMARPFIIKQSPRGQEERVDQNDDDIMKSLVGYLNSIGERY